MKKHDLSVFKKGREDCYKNVEQYLKDIELLIENDSLEHAFALSVIAEEELAKGYCIDSNIRFDSIYEKGVQEYLSSLIRGSTAHIQKIASQKISEYIEDYLTNKKKDTEQMTPNNVKKLYPKLQEDMRPIIIEKSKEFAQEARELQKRRNGCLYVEIGKPFFHQIEKDQIISRVNKLRKLLQRYYARIERWHKVPNWYKEQVIKYHKEVNLPRYLHGEGINE